MEEITSSPKSKEPPSPTTTHGGATPPLTPNPISRSHDTTFVQADTSSFKHVVQMLTGGGAAASHGGAAIPPVKTTGQKKHGFKLYERRNSLKNGLMINTLSPGLSARKPEILSPSILDFPALVLSPMTPLNDDALSRSAAAPSPTAEEERAIADKGFYLHPSPRTAAGNAEPRLLPLFPVTSPRVSGSSSS